MDLALRDRVAFVAGSSRGIGFAIARRLHEEGCRVVLTGRDERALQDAVRSLSGGDRVLSIRGDMTAADDIAAGVAAARDRWGAIDILVANVGSGRARGGWQLEEADWNAAFDINLHGSRRIVEAVVPTMVAAGRGSIVVIASIVGIESVNAPLPYSAAKSALIAYAKNLARVLGRRGVRVNTVAPGNVLFEGGTWASKMAEAPDRVRAFIDTEVPLGRFGEPGEIADLVAFLASDRAAFITGSCIVADGGQTHGY